MTWQHNEKLANPNNDLGFYLHPRVSNSDGNPAGTVTNECVDLPLETVGIISDISNGAQGYNRETSDLEFDGTTMYSPGTNDYILFPAKQRTENKLPFDKPNCTIEFWVSDYGAPAQQYEMIMASDYQSGTGTDGLKKWAVGWDFGVMLNRWKLAWFCDNGARWVFDLGALGLEQWVNADKMCQIVIAKDSSTTGKIYVNGVLRFNGSLSWRAGTHTNDANLYLFGQWNGITSQLTRDWQGRIGVVRAWETDPGEAAHLHNFNMTKKLYMNYRNGVLGE